MFPIIYCPFLFGCRRSWLRWDLVFMFLWLIKSVLWPLHFISKHSLTSLAFLENLSPRERISETAILFLCNFLRHPNLNSISPSINDLKSFFLMSLLLSLPFFLSSLFLMPCSCFSWNEEALSVRCKEQKRWSISVC